MSEIATGENLGPRCGWSASRRNYEKRPAEGFIFSRLNMMTVSEEHYRKLERMYAAGPINRYFAAELTVGKGQAGLMLPVRPDFFHAAHSLHGAVYFKALDDAAYFAVASLVQDVFVLTVSFNVYLTRPVTSGTLHAQGKVVHRSARVFIAEAQVCDSAGRAVGRGSGSFMRGAIALSPAVGYV